MSSLELKYRAISTDDHVQEPPDLWTRRMSKQKFGERIPHLGEAEDGAHRWVMNGEPLAASLAIVASLMPDRRSGPRRWEEVPKASYEPTERLVAMDRDGVDAHTLFPNVSGIARGWLISQGEPDWRLACIEAYNDWLIDEWADVSPRFVPLCLAPLWDAQAAAAEVERSVKRGHRGVVWHGAPEDKGQPHFNDSFWDPLYAKCQELDVPLCLHVDRPPFKLWPGYKPAVAKAVFDSGSISANVHILCNLLFSGVLERFPRLKMVSVESGLGWVPYVLETLDHEWEMLECWKDGMSRKPSEYFHRQVYVNFWYEHVGIEIRRHIGVDNILWETDFPHTTSTYPESTRMRESCLEGVPDDERSKLLVDNAVGLFKLDVVD